MIANITQTKKARPFIDYNENKVEKGVAERIDYNRLGLETREGYENSFELQCLQSDRQDKFMHISLSFAKDDISLLSPGKMIQIADDYLQELGFPEDHMRLIYQHFDTSNPHIHIITPKLIDGIKPLNDAFIRYRSQRATRKLEKKYQLKEVPSVRQSKEVPDGIFIKDDILVENKKERIRSYSNAVQYVLSNYTFSNERGFNRALKEVGLCAKFSKGTYKGEDWEGVTFYSLEEKAKGIKGSLIYGDASAKKMRSIFKRNLTQVSHRDKQIHRYIDSLLYKYIHISKDKYINELLKIGIEVSFIQMGGGDAAISFFDNVLNRSLKPSDLDKKFSYGQMKNRFGAQDIINYSYFNQLKLNLLLKEYRKKFPKPPSDQHRLMFIVKHGFIPHIDNGKLTFNLYSNPDKSSKNNARPVDINPAKIDWEEIQAFIGQRSYGLQTIRNNYLLRGDEEKANRIEEILQNQNDGGFHNQIIRNYRGAIGDFTDFPEELLSQFANIEEDTYIDPAQERKEKKRKGFGYY